MNVFKTTLAAGLVLAAGLGQANVLSRPDIEQAAEGFLKRDGVGSSVLFGRTVRSVEPRGNLWLVRLAPSGYVILAGSDEAEPVPFFSPNDFVEPAEGSAFAAVLSGAGDACAKLETATLVKRSLCLMTLSSASATSDDEVSTRRKARWSSLLGTASTPVQTKLLRAASNVPSKSVVVAPFLSAHWEQWQPYNDYAPLHDSTETGSYRGRAPCGCVATASAQGFHHWKWPVRIDEVRTVTHRFAPDGKEKGYADFDIRFDGRVPFDWSVFDDKYSYSGDMRGNVAESVRYPVARLVFLCGSLANMKYAPEGSGANFSTVRVNSPWYQGGEWLTLQEDGKKESDWSTSVERFRSNMANRIPVQVSIPGHAIVGHGWAESGGTKYVYINYGWGGSNDGYYNLDDVSSDDRIEDIYVDFVPRKMVQLDPVPKVSDSSVCLDWHLPECYAGTVQGFTVARAALATTPANAVEDFEMTTTSGSFSLTNDSKYSNSQFLRVGSLSRGTCSVGDECVLTSQSVLTYDIFSRFALGLCIEVQASYDGGEWTTLAAPFVYAESEASEWESRRIYLGDHGGRHATFRIKCTINERPYYYPKGFVGIDNFAVSSVLRYVTEGTQSVESAARTCTLTGLTAGSDYRFTVTPQFSDGGGASDSVFTATVGPESAVSALGMPTIDLVSYESPAFAEGFYRENAMGSNVFYVTCSSSVVSLTASPSHVALLPDDKVTVHALGQGRFAVVIDASQIPARYSRSRMILTLAASDANGTTVCKDLSMRFSLQTSPQIYVPEVPTAVEIKEGGLTVSVPTSWLVENGLVASGASAADQVAAAKADADGDGQDNWKEYVCGTDPNDETENLKCLISFADGEVKIDYTPKNLQPGFTPVYQGRADLGSGSWQKMDAATHRFFRVVIEQ